MTTDRQLDNPTGRAAATFDTHAEATAARKGLEQNGFAVDRIHLLYGDADAAGVDAAPKWFSDTDLDIAVFKSKLEQGGAVVTVEIDDDDALQTAHGVFENTGAEIVTHFGTWVITTENVSKD